MIEVECSVAVLQIGALEFAQLSEQDSRDSRN